MLHLLCPLVVCRECPESGSSGLGVATSREIMSSSGAFHHVTCHQVLEEKG